MTWVRIMVPAVVFGIASFTVPSAGRTTRWRTRAAERLERLAKHLRHKPKEADPFEVLSVQMRLSVIAADIRAIEDEPHLYARAHHLHAARVAYDDLLAEACRLAGLEPGPRMSFSVPEEKRFDERLREEVELTALGWTW
ncbi:hypothetical protein [Cellulomonas sp. P24]|uniref:hypothetical protein n=1 Tax=Cellulomonas sp. P24 TaxID=2885206 RepID=UPI00216B13D5|nr:hypothetical protein [Cellulomonas sp. P24]MCR6492949.1 hypothetical protein [Cellulomonas sp. P24]